MIILAIDPGLTCTGWAVISPHKLHSAGTCIPKAGGTAWVRCQQIMDDIAEVVGGLRSAGAEPALIVVETPQTFTRGMLKKRSPATLPGYGMAVMAALVAAKLSKSAGCELLETSASEWAINAPKVKGDDDKIARVEAVGHLYGRDKLAGMAKQKAAAIADAVLMAGWAMDRKSKERKRA